MQHLDDPLHVERYRVCEDWFKHTQDITCPLFLLAGARDHITPPAQLFAAADAVGTPPGQIVQRTATGGHLGLFTGREALTEDWPVLMAAVRARSNAG